MTLKQWGFQNFHRTCIIFFAVQLKHSSFWPSADVKCMAIELAHVTTLCGVCLDSLCVYYDVYGFQQKHSILA